MILELCKALDMTATPDFLVVPSLVLRQIVCNILLPAFGASRLLF